MDITVISFGRKKEKKGKPQKGNSAGKHVVFISFFFYFYFF